MRPGYVSYIIVLSTGLMLTMLTMSAYRQAVLSQEVQSEAQLRADYADKEDAVLRALVNLVPNRAIRSMQHLSNANSSTRRALTWEQIFSDALDQANARRSISRPLLESVDGESAVVGNSGDAALGSIGLMFDAIEPESGFVAPGINRSLGTGFPVPLQTANDTVAARDRVYPIISRDKIFGELAAAGVGLPVTKYSGFNVIPYPEIRFGYAAPGQPFVAKRNWWAFSMQLGEHESLLGSFGREGGSSNERDFVVSIYEIPSQLAISAEAFTKLGMHADGTPWQNVSIEGGVYSTRAEVDGGMHIERLSGRRGLTLGNQVTVGDRDLGGDPFEPGVRERFEATHGDFLPVTMASESGRAAFFPINRGKAFFDRFAHAPETDVLSSTTWNSYSVGALQCAMRLDVTEVASSTDPTPTALRFQYFKGGVRESLELSLGNGPDGLPFGYVRIAAENESHVFEGLNDVAYGSEGLFHYQSGVTGTVTFNSQTFGDPNPGKPKEGYFRPSLPFEVKLLHESKLSIAVYPERLPGFLAAIGADGTEVNHSLVVNVDYSTSGLNNPAYKPAIPATENDYGLLLSECDDLRAFSKGFSLVTNLRLYIGDDFNIVATTPPAGSGLASPFYPPASLFAPEKRYGTEYDPFRVRISGQIGHLGGEEAADGQPVHLLDVKMGSEEAAEASKINVNLQPITHPAQLPPVTMMNWLVTVEERRKGFYTATGSN
ncbi:MAG: hypothetical protein EAZ84_11620 [Verrucomicrobia bacterium]|nr:MAG: hypothetical protein EAZ84_11620 [Verrucomicrobiota bacterium]TAE88712.1 MAG: hypothetical protein EAZ82_03155 [Verrucomicrobiota bacterium]TAF26514.1 MAG: hypothetical protein EAZ71_04680 [Verrucomicrobiota bacterium]